MNRIRIPAIVFLWTLILLFANGFITAMANDFPMTIRDMTGNSVNLNREPSRIISLAASTTEILFSLGLQDRIIGVTGECNYPPEAKLKTSVGSIYLDYEKIVLLKPDLVALEDTLQHKAIEKLEKLRIPTLVIRSDTYENFLKTIEIIGRATGKEMRASRLIEKIQSNMNAVAERVRTISTRQRPKVFVEIWNRPLMTAGGDTFISYVVENAGGINIARDMTGYPQINTETLLVRNPDVIILTTSTRKNFINAAYCKNLEAVKNNRVFEINPDILVRPTMRLFESSVILYNRFYPDSRFTFQGKIK